ncbi:MAG: choice-of-anchor E domain-containing protein [Pseudoalteromonas sp.]|nr:choice-of-anchor E domain-containing protein [Pseudoalteromonas sp.]
MKILAAILLICASTAQAGVITQTKSFGTQGATKDADFGLGRLAHTVTLDAFDSKLGTLNKVVVTLKGQIDSAGSVTNESESVSYSKVSLNLMGSWGVNEYAFDCGELYSTNTGGYTIESGGTFEYNYSSGEQIYTLDMDPELFTDDVHFKYYARLYTQFINITKSGSSRFINQNSTATWGEVTAKYFYTPVPAPATWFMLAGVAFLLLRVASNRHI